MTVETEKKKYKIVSKEEKQLKQEYHLIFTRGTYVFSWRTQKYGNYRETFGTNLDKANKKALRWIDSIESGIDPRIEEKKKSFSFEELFEGFIHEKKLRNIAVKSIKRYQATCKVPVN